MVRPKSKNKPPVKRPSIANTNACLFCNSEEDNEEAYGKLLKKCDITIHYFCMLFSSGLWQRGKRDRDGILGFMPDDIFREHKRGNRLTCQYCRKKGATIGCVVTSCRKTFHFRCGRDAGGLCQFFNEFRSYCPDHRLCQESHTSDRLAFYGTAKSTCCICMLSVEARASNDTLRAPCCRKAWFHRDCIQRYAWSAGAYFFKCPLCNNKELFEAEMLEFGIYVPEQDAAWEQDPYAFQDLLERHCHCDTQPCLCPKGREYDGPASSRWEIILCDWCGSCGTHRDCKGFTKFGKDMVCKECAELSQSAKLKKTKKSLSPVQYSMDKVRLQLEQRRSANMRAQRAARRHNNDITNGSNDQPPGSSQQPDVCGNQREHASGSSHEPDVCGNQREHASGSSLEPKVVGDQDGAVQTRRRRGRPKKGRCSPSLLKDGHLLPVVCIPRTPGKTGIVVRIEHRDSEAEVNVMEDDSEMSHQTSVPVSPCTPRRQRLSQACVHQVPTLHGTKQASSQNSLIESHLPPEQAQVTRVQHDKLRNGSVKQSHVTDFSREHKVSEDCDEVTQTVACVQDSSAAQRSASVPCPLSSVDMNHHSSPCDHVAPYGLGLEAGTLTETDHVKLLSVTRQSKYSPSKNVSSQRESQFAAHITVSKADVHDVPHTMNITLEAEHQQDLLQSPSQKLPLSRIYGPWKSRKCLRGRYLLLREHNINVRVVHSKLKIGEGSHRMTRSESRNSVRQTRSGSELSRRTKRSASSAQHTRLKKKNKTRFDSKSPRKGADHSHFTSVMERRAGHSASLNESCAVQSVSASQSAPMVQRKRDFRRPFGKQRRRHKNRRNKHPEINSDDNNNLSDDITSPKKKQQMSSEDKTVLKRKRQSYNVSENKILLKRRRDESGGKDVWLAVQVITSGQGRSPSLAEESQTLHPQHDLPMENADTDKKILSRFEDDHKVDVTPDKKTDLVENGCDGSRLTSHDDYTQGIVSGSATSQPYQDMDLEDKQPSNMETDFSDPLLSSKDLSQQDLDSVSLKPSYLDGRQTERERQHDLEQGYGHSLVSKESLGGGETLSEDEGESDFEPSPPNRSSSTESMPSVQMMQVSHQVRLP